jgi:hypothetical protein
MLKLSTIKLAIATAGLVILSTSVLHAQQLNDHDNGPLSGLFGLPDSTEGAVLVGKTRFRTDAVFSAASHSVIEIEGDETLFLDGETRRLEVSLRYGMGDRFEVGLELPFLWHESGGLDSLIDGFHAAVGLPDGFRPLQPIDSLQFRYTSGGVDQVNLSSNTRGLGDIRLTGGWLLSESENRRYALRAGLKLATGNGDELLGSGSNDLSLGLAGNYDAWLGNPRLSAYFIASAVWLGEPDLLADRYEALVGHVAAGMGFRALERLELRLQTTARTSLYDSDIEHLGETAMTLTFGGNIQLADRWRLSVAVAEDAKTSSAPDIVFQLGVHYQPSGLRPDSGMR